MPMIGASLEDLANVSSKYQITTGVIRDFRQHGGGHG